jgi:hypothetical protein
MSKHETTIIIHRPAEQAIEFEMDVSLWSGWHPDNIEARQTSEGALDVGDCLSARSGLG